MTKIKSIAYIAHSNCLPLLLDELNCRLSFTAPPTIEHEDLLYYDKLPNNFPFNISPIWARVVLYNPIITPIKSIKEASLLLRGVAKLWSPYAPTLYRRLSLIQDSLPYIPLKKRTFPFLPPASPIGCYTLLDTNTLLYSADTSSTFPLGSILLEEDHKNPPSRAYLKVQEALIRAASCYSIPFPSSNSLCLDCGASPGGWTYVLTTLGAKVIAVDRAPLSPSLMENKQVSFICHDAFTLLPSDIGNIDYLFSDVACYPCRLYDYIVLWIKSKRVKYIIATIKLQDFINQEDRYKELEKFIALPNSHLLHLTYNKHELTFFYRAS